MQHKGATHFEEKVWEIGVRVENEMEAGEFATAISGALFDSVEKLQILRKAIVGYQEALKGLAKFKNNKTLFEGDVVKDQEVFEAWKALNEAGVNAKNALNAYEPSFHEMNPTNPLENQR